MEYRIEKKEAFEVIGINKPMHCKIKNQDFGS